jgi:hypothetical protein
MRSRASRAVWAVSRPAASEAARHRRDERSAARVIGVFAEDLDTAWHQPRPRGRPADVLLESGDGPLHQHGPGRELPRSHPGPREAVQ